MQLSLVDYLTMVKELMDAVGFTEEQVNTNMKNLQEGYVTIENLSANVAIQCFVRQHESVNADILRSLLKEFQINKEVKFND